MRKLMWLLLSDNANYPHILSLWPLQDSVFFPNLHDLQPFPCLLHPYWYGCHQPVHICPICWVFQLTLCSFNLQSIIQIEYLYLEVSKVKGSWRAKTGKLLSTYLNGKFHSCYCWSREKGTKKRSGAKSCCWDWMEISESKAGHAALQAHDVAVQGKQEISFVPCSLEI